MRAGLQCFYFRIYLSRASVQDKEKCYCCGQRKILVFHPGNHPGELRNYALTIWSSALPPRHSISSRLTLRVCPFFLSRRKIRPFSTFWNSHSRISTYIRTSCRSLTFTPGQIALGVHWWSSKLLPPSLGAPFLKQIVLVRSLAKKLFIYSLIRVIQGKGYKNLFFLKLVQNICSFMVEFLVQIGRSFAISMAFIPNRRQKTFSVFN